MSQCRGSILVAAGKVATSWSERGIALGGMLYRTLFRWTHPGLASVIVLVTFLHSLTPRVGVFIMNVRTYLGSLPSLLRML